jgi:hypothetical protein
MAFLMAVAAIAGISSGANTTPEGARCILSNVFGDHMVLQRAPQAATVWGFAPTGTTVKTYLDKRTTLTTTADAAGVWRQALPPTAASTTGQTISFVCSSGETIVLNDVLFGDLHICGECGCVVN